MTSMGPKTKRLRVLQAEPMAEAAPTAAHIVLKRACPSVVYLAHVAQGVNGYLDHTHKWDLESASKAGHPLLLDRLAASEWPGLSSDFRKTRFLRNVEVAAQLGHVHVLHWWRTKYLPGGPDVAGFILQTAAFKGHSHVIQRLFETDPNAQSIAGLKSPLVCSVPEVVYYLHEHSRRVRMKIRLEEAARRGDLEFLKWVKAQRYEFDVSHLTLVAAAEAGHVEVLQYLIKQSPHTDPSPALAKAVEYGRLPVVQWLIESGKSLDLDYLDMLEHAAFEDHWHVVKWLIDKLEWSKTNSGWIESIICQAAMSGNMEMLQYLYELHPSKTLGNLVDYGVNSADLEIVQWLHDRGSESSEEDIFRDAVDTGDLEMIKWVHSNTNGRPSSMYTMDCAASFSLDIVIWLHENRSEGCSSNAMDTAAACGSLEIVKWLHANRSEGTPATAIVNAASKGHLDVVQYLHDHCSKEAKIEAMKAAIAGEEIYTGGGYLEIVQWLHENGLNDRKTINSAY